MSRVLRPGLAALAFVLLLGQVQAATHRLLHPVAARACEVCALAHVPLALAPSPLATPPTPDVHPLPKVGAFRSEPFVAIGPPAVRAPPGLRTAHSR